MHRGGYQLPRAAGEHLSRGHPGNFHVGRGLRLLLGVCAGTVLLGGPVRRSGGCRCARDLPTDYLDWRDLLRGWPECRHGKLPVQLRRRDRKPDSVLQHGEFAVHGYVGRRPIVPGGIAAVCILPLRGHMCQRARSSLARNVHELPALMGPSVGMPCRGASSHSWCAAPHSHRSLVYR